MVGGGGPPQSPWTFTAQDHLGRSINAVFEFNNITRVLTQATFTRHVDCLYRKIYVDVGVDRRPESSAKQVTVPAGGVVRPGPALQAIGLTTIEDIVGTQITAGP